MLLEFFGVVSSLLYLFLEIKQKRSMWIVGIVSSAVYAIVFTGKLLYASAGIQIFYILISLYGLKKWYGGVESEEEITVVPSKNIILLSIAASVFTFFSIYLLLRNLSEDPYPMADSFIASMGIIATFWLSKKFIEQWYIWIAVNLFSAFFYLHSTLYLTFALYLIYFAASIAGLMKWRKFRRVLK